MTKHVLFAILILLFSVQVCLAAPAVVWETGQTTSYAPGDDGNLRPGISWPNPRFTDNGNGAVKDNLTGLIWLKNANCFGVQTWTTALSSANNLANGNCGLTDGSIAGQWRLPNLEELYSLVDFAFYSPSLSNTAGTAKWTAGYPFTNVQSSDYWSATTYAPNTAYAWVVSMYNGFVDYNGKASSSYVWPVRAGSGLFGNSAISVSPSSKNFGAVKPGSSSSAQTFTVTNTGTNNLYIGSLSRSGTDASMFSIQTDNCSNVTVSPVGTCTVDVVFSPVTSGAKSASLSIPSNAPTSPTTVALSGTGAQFTVIATATGNGTGAISSSAGGISYSYPSSNTGTTSALNYGTVLTLTASAGTGSTVSWTTCNGTVSGNGTTSATCAYTSLDGNKTAQATFTLTTYTLTVNTAGNGSGTVGGGGTYGYGTSHDVTASADTGSTFTGWSGDCAGSTSPYSVTILDRDMMCTAIFTLNTHTLTVNSAGNGSGTVGGGGTYGYGTSHDVTASADTGSTFTGWSGDCAGSTSPYSVTMLDRDMMCTATFMDITPPVDGALNASPSDTSVALNWTAATDSGTGVASYKLVYQSGGTPPANCSSGTTIYSGGNLSYTHVGRASSTQYSYRVCAYDAANNVSTGATATATTLAATLPSQPGTINIATMKTAGATITWGTVNNATTYNIYRSTDGVTWTLAGSVSPPATSFIDSGVPESNTTYHWTVTAQNSAGESVKVVEASGRTALLRGWNCVSAPVATSGQSAAAIYGPWASWSYTWIPTGNLDPDNNGYWQFNPGIVPGQSQFVWVTNDTTVINTSGSENPPAVTVTLKPGWTPQTEQSIEYKDGLDDRRNNSVVHSDYRQYHRRRSLLVERQHL